MPFAPKHLTRPKLPKFQSPDKGLADALNLLARAIESIEVPDVRLTNGRMEWSGRSLLLTPDAVNRKSETFTPPPWWPTFLTENNQPKVRFNLGTVNGVIASNWNTALNMTDQENVFQFVLLTVTTASGKVTSVKLSVESQAPTEDTITPDVPPPQFKIVLGAVGKGVHKMIVNQNIEMVAEEVFREPIKAPPVGEEPVKRWWRWKVTQ